MNNQILLTTNMAYSNSQVIGRDIQGMIFSSDIGEEQGDLYDPSRYDIESNYSWDDSYNILNRYPSSSMFDKDKALLKSFGVASKIKNTDSYEIPESEQLGIMINSSVRDDMERLSLDYNIQSNPYWQKPDEASSVKSDERENFDLSNNKQKDDISNNDNRDYKSNDENEILSIEESKNDSDNIDSNRIEFREIRWRKEDDKKLFANYRALWRNAMLNIKDVVSMPLKKNKQHKQIIQKVGEAVGWKGKTSMLSKRIKKILTNHELSIREKQDLTRLYKQQVKKSELDWEKILYEFPGKTLIYVKEFWKQIKVKIKPQISTEDKSDKKNKEKATNFQKCSKLNWKDNQSASQLFIQPFKDWNIKDSFSSYFFEEETLSK